MSTGTGGSVTAGGSPGGGTSTGTGGVAGTGGHCGNGVIESGEACDGTSLGSAGCSSLGYASGNLACLADCSAFDASGCYKVCDTTALPIQTSTFTSTVTPDGTAWPSGGISGGGDTDASLVFVRTDNQNQFPVRIGTGGAVARKLLQGNYDILFRGNYSSVLSAQQEVSLLSHCRIP